MNTNKKGFTPLEILAGKGKQRGNQKFLTGFTLIELLVVVAIIGLLSSIVGVALNNSRTKARDARRVSDMKQAKSGLDLYFSHGAGYPDTATWTAATSSSLSCSGVSIMRIPIDPVSASYVYTYTASGNLLSGCGTIVRSDYELEFYIENKAKYYIMDEDGTVRDKVTGSAVSFDTLL